MHAAIPIEKLNGPPRIDRSSLQLGPEVFRRISLLIHRTTGIHLRPGKEELVRTRLYKRLLLLNLPDFEEYWRYVRRDRTGLEMENMIDALTTNKTEFFREMSHFDFLRDQICPSLRTLSRVRLWSAGCSSGEEAFSLAIRLRESLGSSLSQEVAILATDISSRSLEKARAAVYNCDAVRSIQPGLLDSFFEPLTGTAVRQWRVHRTLRDMVYFARLNLADQWPMRGPFQAIFCRNVMIYFDKATQERLVNRFHSLLCRGGFLFIGHSESLTGLKQPYRFIQPAVYQRVE